VNEREQAVLDAESIARIVRRMAVEILERTAARPVGLVGVRRGGVPIAQRLSAEIERLEGRSVPVWAVDISLYRDDAAMVLPDPKIGPSAIDYAIDGLDVVLVDDVLHTGRTVRAAIDCLLDYGRPRRIWLAALCDRGGRELPVAPDFVGRTLEVPEGATLHVVAEGGSEDHAVIVRKAGP
jgi:pyrimidine operon attenuation protein/uracil phosphoribosyltransferase